MALWNYFTCMNIEWPWALLLSEQNGHSSWRTVHNVSITSPEKIWGRFNSVWLAAGNHGLGLFGQDSSETASAHKTGSSLHGSQRSRLWGDRMGAGVERGFPHKGLSFSKNTHNYCVAMKYLAANLYFISFFRVWSALKSAGLPDCYRWNETYKVYITFK